MHANSINKLQNGGFLKMDQNAAIQHFLDLERISQLKAGYCRFLDTKQWDRFRTLFAPDARFDGFGSAPSGSDVAAFVQGVANRHKDSITVHQCHMPEIVFTGPDKARAIWAMMDYCEWPAGYSPKEAPEARGFYGYGHYEEEYSRIDGEWKISFLRLTRLRIDPIPDDNALPRPVRVPASKDWLP